MNQHNMDIGRLVGVPAFLEPWLDRFYEPKEASLLQCLGNRAREPEAVLSKTALSLTDLDRAWRRGVVERDEKGRVRAADFHVRFDIWSVFEGWKDIPPAVQEQLGQWELDYYCRCHMEDVEAVQR
jgi:hypothetical protein